MYENGLPLNEQAQSTAPGWNIDSVSPPPNYDNLPPPLDGCNGQNSNSPPPNSCNVEYGGIPKNEMGFNRKSIRAAFVRKVFGIVFIMLAIVAAMSLVPKIWPQAKKFLVEHFYIIFVGWCIYIVVYIILICSKRARRNFPFNIIMLALLTLSIGLTTTMLTALIETWIVVTALAITTLSCIGVVLFSIQTKYDLVSCIGVLSITAFTLLTIGLSISLLYLFSENFRIAHAIYSALMAVIFMFFLAVDVQLMIGGCRCEISPEDYVYAATEIFMDIITIFWYILAALGDSQ